MLTLAKTIREYSSDSIKFFDVGYQQDFVRFLDNGSIVSCFDNEETILDGFNTEALLSFIDKTEHLQSFNVVNDFQIILVSFIKFESFDNNKQALFDVLLSDYYNYDLETLVNYVEDNACLFEGSASDYAFDFVDSCYNIDKMMGSLASYFDYESLGRDLVLGGDIVEIGRNLFWTNPNDIY